MPVIEFIVNEILSVPAYLVGLIVAVGLAVMGKSVGEIIGGGLKAVLGFLILGAGAGVVVAALEPLGVLILEATGAQGVVPTNEAIVSIAVEEFGAQVAWIMVAGFLLSLVIARLTPLKYVFLTGHHMFFMAAMLAAVLAVTDLSALLIVIIGALLLATIMQVMPAFSQPFTKQIIGNDSLAIGHFGTAGYIAAGYVGKVTGKHSRSTEDLRVPDGLRFLRDTMIATALSMCIFYVVFATWVWVKIGGEAAFELLGASDGGNFIMQGIYLGLQFGIGVSIILYGVRIILAELVPAFEGISSKLVPGAAPALDIPIVFPFAANAVLVGFIASFVGGLVSFGLLAWVFGPAFGLALILPGMVPHFFTGGGAGVFGNATGGRRGAILGAFTNGVLISFLPAFLLLVLGELGFANTTFGDADFGWYGVLIGNSVQFGALGAIIGPVLISLGLLSAAIWYQKKFVDSGWEPGKEHAEWVTKIEAEEDAEEERKAEAKKAAEAAQKSG